MATARNTALSPSSPPQSPPNLIHLELAGQISIHIADLKKTHYADIASTIDDVLDDIASRPVTADYSEETRRQEYQLLLRTTQKLTSRVADDTDLLKMASDILEQDSGRCSRAWKRFGNALLGVAGTVLFVTGTFALCSGLGILPGGFLASAGAWLLGLAGLAKGAVAVGLSATVAAVGAAGWLGSLCNAFGLFRPSPRERLFKGTTELTHGAKP